MYKLIFFFIFGISILELSAQNFDRMIHMAWQNNHQLKAKEFQLKSAVESFREAKANFGPAVVLGIQYTLAQGGRSISVPVGDLMNPVYTTLNHLTNSNVFPQIENTKEMLFPNNFYDARFRISQAIFFPDLSIQKKLKNKVVDLKSLEIKAFKRFLSKEVMLSALQWNSAYYALKIYSASDSLIDEAIRASNSLVKNGVSLPSSLLRLEDQRAESEIQQATLKAQSRNLKDYLELVTGDTLSEQELAATLVQQYPQLDEELSIDREEIQQIELGIQMQQLLVKKEKQFYFPKIGAQMDLGSQAFDFGFSPYALLGINIELPLYDHGKHNFRSLTAKAEIQSLEEQKQDISRQFELQIEISKRNLNTAIQQAKSFEHRIQTSSKLYQEIFAKYKQGTANYLELLDAQNQWTQSRLQQVIAINTAWMKWADYIYSTSKYSIQ